ncbi:hypothetical protein AVEN_85247-1 [Araneus ventricosus]|uniref:Uncharacterized protein n=1 Tax=Araneus ventricosus TaxID=182803 RepID=A0A4Y2W021_ARAVE|nr:hypothetical protein AVEN_242380-1 [Araneus ventricosus]GBO30304.1 hypothetical protein AVEN_12073-1 [Araneus ventricosus]GBO30309.1 hypothetical protein AVEN_76411-1 [Araneus ventricosus]GBO30312.1 hypothetical protein AVEN_85247-1 [Araneus ventricosus]
MKSSNGRSISPCSPDKQLRLFKILNLHKYAGKDPWLREDSAAITWFRNFLYLYLKPHEGDCGLVVRLRRCSWKVPSSKPESPSCIGPVARYIIRTGSDSPQLAWCGSLAREGRAQVPSSSSDRDSELHCEARI